MTKFSSMLMLAAVAFSVPLIVAATEDKPSEHRHAHTASVAAAGHSQVESAHSHDGLNSSDKMRTVTAAQIAHLGPKAG